MANKRQLNELNKKHDFKITREHFIGQEEPK